MAKPLNIGLIGFGNIGTGVVRTLAEHADLYKTRLPRDIVLKRICDRDTTAWRNAPYEAEQLTDNVDDILDDPEIEVVIELIGGLEPAKTFIERALNAGKHVVTANKHLLAYHGTELMALADQKDVGLLYEAAVAGGIPIIRALQQGLTANELHSVMGILNGTCNYVLSRMSEVGEDESFEEVLADAQQLGLAEPDPTYDIEGFDTAHKTAILASLAFGMDIRFEDVYVEGITQIQAVDVAYARKLGYTIRLLGIAKRDEVDGAVEVRVHPTLIPDNSPLGQVLGEFNSVQVDGEPIGRTMFYGKGAGPGPTASAIISDLMAIAADIKGFNAHRDARLPIRVGHKHLKPMDELVTNYYVRFMMADRPGAMATIGQALAAHNVSIESMIQQPRTEEDMPEEDIPERAAAISIVTHQTQEAALQAAIRDIEKHEMCIDRAFVLRVED